MLLQFICRFSRRALCGSTDTQLFHACPMVRYWHREPIVYKKDGFYFDDGSLFTRDGLNQTALTIVAEKRAIGKVKLLLTVASSKSLLKKSKRMLKQRICSDLTSMKEVRPQTGMSGNFSANL